MIADLLSKVDEYLLQREVRRIPLADAVGMGGGGVNGERLAAFLKAYYGYDILTRESIRHCLLTLVALDALNEAAKSLGLPEARYVYDAALIVASAEWSVDAPLSGLFRRLVEERLSVRLPEQYFPGVRVERTPTVEDVESDPAPPLFHYQRQVSEGVGQVLCTSAGRAMVQMPTGSGKTRTVMDAIARRLRASPVSGSFLWLAHSEELCEQAVGTFKRSWLQGGAGIVRVCRLWGEHAPTAEDITNGMVVAGLQKLVSLLKKRTLLYERLSASCAAVIFDEAHKALAPTYRELLCDLLERSSRASLIGLTATPGRSATDFGQNRALAHLFENRLIRLDFGDKDPIEALRDMGILARLKRVRVESPARFKLSDSEKRFVEEFFELPSSVLQRLGENTQRNLLIVATLVDLVKKGCPTIVFACSVEHARVIAAMASLKGIAACSVTSDMTSTARARCIGGFRTGAYGAIVNYGVLSTGFDAPNTKAVMITRPTASVVLYSQMIGRGMRGPKVGGNAETFLVDIVDNIEGFGAEREIFDFFAGYWQ